MPNLILHVGHPKTGSSYIQSILSINQNYLKKYHLNYPSTLNFEDSQKGFVTSGNGGKFLDSEGKLLYKFDNQTSLFSEECFFYRLLSWEGFNEFFSKNANKVKVICYTRNLIECEISDWGQLIKRHHLTLDINSYLQRSHTKRYRALLEWIEASNKYNFEIKIRNYSELKDNLLKYFFEDCNLKDIDLNKLKKPPFNNINRSLTISEYEIIRVLNIIQPKENIADILVNLAPEIKSEKILISEDSYKKVVNKNEKLIKEINNYLDEKEVIKIESQKDVCVNKKDEKREFLNKRQIEIISNYLINSYYKDENLYHKDDAPILFNIAKKIVYNKKSLNLNDALDLLKISKKIRPQGSIIMNEFRKIKNLIREMRTKTLYKIEQSKTLPKLSTFIRRK